MSVLKDYRCVKCEKVAEAWSDEIPICHGQRMGWNPTPVFSPEWGGPKTMIHIRDEPFSSRGEFSDYCKKEGLSLSPSADKHGGARNEDHMHLGKKYSYPGAPTS